MPRQFACARPAACFQLPATCHILCACCLVPCAAAAASWRQIRRQQHEIASNLWPAIFSTYLAICCSKVAQYLLSSLSVPLPSPSPLPSRPVILCLAICRHFYDLQHCLSCCFWGSQIVAFLMPHWNHICIGAHRYLCFSVFPLFHPSVYPLSALKAKTLTFCHIPPLAAIQFAPSAINHRQSSRVSFLSFPSWGENLCICFSCTKETHFNVYVCVCCSWICIEIWERERGKESFQTKIISRSSLITAKLFLSSELG